MKAGGNVPEDCSALKIDCSFLPERISQPSIWDLDHFMIASRLVVVHTDDNHRCRQKRRLRSHTYFIKNQISFSRGHLAKCELIFLRYQDIVTDPNRIVGLAVMSTALGYFDYAISAMRKISLSSEFVRDKHGFDFESELQLRAAMLGRQRYRTAICKQYRTFVPYLRRHLWLLPHVRPIGLY